MAKKEEATTTQQDAAAKMCWHSITVQETAQKLDAAADLTTTGLTNEEAARRLQKYGENKLSEGEKETIWQKIWKQVANVLVCILVVVALVSAARAIVEETREDRDSTTVLTSWVQVGLITMVITVNTAIGILQEGSAEAAAEALKNMLSADALVIRDGVETMIPAQNVVPGDVIILSLGDKVPADMRIFNSANLACGEAALTGESVPIDKTTDAIVPKAGEDPENTPLGDRHNMCFSATLVAQGSGKGIAVTTGDYTQIGTINRLVSQVEKKKTNVLEQIDKVSKLLAILIVTATFITGVIAKVVAEQSWFEAISTALVCCVAMIPEGLEAIVTLVYAWATTNMAKQNAIIRALPAVETLGSVTVICSDKTGTLTQNVMSLQAFVTSNARYKFDVNATDRVPSNFVRDDSYYAERAGGSLDKSVHGVIAGGVNAAGQKRKGHLESSNHFSIDNSLHATEGGDDREPLAEAYPFAPGTSPTLKFVQDAIQCGVLCSKCKLGDNGGREGEIGNPTEISILRSAYFSGVDIDKLKTDLPLVAEVPFSSEYKFMATVHEEVGSEDYRVFVKGAPDRMVKMCANQAKAGVVGETEDLTEDYWINQIAILSSHGLRVLALCQASIPKSTVSHGENLDQSFVNGKDRWLTMIGLCAIMDPPRPECVDAISEAKGAGIRVAMITGDHKDTAAAIGTQLGIVDNRFPGAITGPELDAMTDTELQQCVMQYNVFARASPQNKIRIVKALQAQKQISSMTGDGVNDAPALKAADMGVAMGLEGTDVAREASDMILADDNFATIVTAVREGRVVWDNLRKVLLINTPINNAQGLSVLFGLAFGLKQSPLSPIQVLYSNLICAITLGFVSAIEPAEDGIMDMAPRRIGKRLIGRYLFLRILLGTFTLTGLVIAGAFILKGRNPDGILPEYSARSDFAEDYPGYNMDDIKYWMEDVRAISFNILDFGAIGVTLSARFAYLSAIHPRILYGNKYCWYSVAIVAILQVGITHIPGLNETIFLMRGMDGLGWGITFAFMFVVFFVMEAEKAVRRILRARGADTDDTEMGAFDDNAEANQTVDPSLPKGASNLNLVALEK